MSTPLSLMVSFVIVLVLIMGIFWLVRGFGVGRFGKQAARNRQPRLAVIEASTVDGRRRLVLIRRDNVEHLLMIGGPTDVVIEPNIVRAQGNIAREITAARAAPSEPMPRAEPSSWPLQPEPAAPRAPRPVTAEDGVPWLQPAQPDIPRRRSEPLGGLSADLPRPSMQPTDGGSHPRQAPPVEPPRPPSQAAPAIPTPATATADQNLADMAQRLEAALRRPGNSSDRPAPEKSAAPAAASPPAAAHAPAGSDKGKPAAYDSLEQEMASLLGRQPAKQ